MLFQHAEQWSRRVEIVAPRLLRGPAWPPNGASPGRGRLGSTRPGTIERRRGAAAAATFAPTHCADQGSLFLKDIVYSCSFTGYDWSFAPLRDLPGVQFVRFMEKRPPLLRRWRYRPIPGSVRQPTQTLTNRFCKLHPHLLFPEADLAVYVDGNVLVTGDLGPLIDAFRTSGQDLALFPHPSGRTVGEEIDFALKVGKIPESARPRAMAQRAAYAEEGLLSEPITENTIIFWNLASPTARLLGETWWQELVRFTQRDQISLPKALRQTGARVHVWDWHFGDGTNPYFVRYAHKKGNLRQDLIQASWFLKDHYLLHRMLFSMIRAGGRVRRTLSALRPGRTDRL